MLIFLFLVDLIVTVWSDNELLMLAQWAQRIHEYYKQKAALCILQKKKKKP